MNHNCPECPSQGQDQYAAGKACGATTEEMVALRLLQGLPCSLLLPLPPCVAGFPQDGSFLQGKALGMEQSLGWAQEQRAVGYEDKARGKSWAYFIGLTIVKTKFLELYSINVVLMICLLHLSQILSLISLNHKASYGFIASS